MKDKKNKWKIAAAALAILLIGSIGGISYAAWLSAQKNEQQNIEDITTGDIKVNEGEGIKGITYWEEDMKTKALVPYDQTEGFDGDTMTKYLGFTATVDFYSGGAEVHEEYINVKLEKEGDATGKIYESLKYYASDSEIGVTDLADLKDHCKIVDNADNTGFTISNNAADKTIFIVVLLDTNDLNLRGQTFTLVVTANEVVPPVDDDGE
ncbi:MAG: hypothetical protein LBH47_01180 [Christensenellaceae bacterium]|jgi:hypothetical protein|nr:hypothetical protein [Christensenellaceae bacterium]